MQIHRSELTAASTLTTSVAALVATLLAACAEPPDLETSPARSSPCDEHSPGPCATVTPAANGWAILVDYVYQPEQSGLTPNLLVVRSDLPGHLTLLRASTDEYLDTRGIAPGNGYLYTLCHVDETTTEYCRDYWVDNGILRCPTGKRNCDGVCIPSWHQCHLQ